jgi:hypothetical protein
MFMESVAECSWKTQTLLKNLGFSHVSARPRHPGQDVEIIAAFKKTSPKR